MGVRRGIKENSSSIIPANWSLVLIRTGVGVAGEGGGVDSPVPRCAAITMVTGGGRLPTPEPLAPPSRDAAPPHLPSCPLPGESPV